MSDEHEHESGGGEEQRIKSIEELQAAQAEQGSKIDQILGILGKKEEGAHSAAQAHTEERLDRSSSIADQVRAAVEAADAEKAQKAAADEHAAEHAALREAREKPPRELAGGARGRLQKIMFGTDK
jgi:ABC-type nitrate/sulfonate/bicarbonate transport system ATPase subunit